ncbi:hypothetical protein [Paenibacillus alkalitolerans]|uniref:hypothetical protein n=1 Tax=Paenibacillus alkalitolerans TaxID=2799335 RepID=UPI001F383808|nr:hypothetical protein [Paenibacillus alkalitolerans]
MYNMYAQNQHYMMQAPVHPAVPNRQEAIAAITPWVQYGIREAQFTGFPHAMLEVGLIAFLMGRGIHPHVAHQIVESWEVNESFNKY